jgi:hypothetical protein
LDWIELDWIGLRNHRTHTERLHIEELRASKCLFLHEEVDLCGLLPSEDAEGPLPEKGKALDHSKDFSVDTRDVRMLQVGLP